jgi:hypothetical protein
MLLPYTRRNVGAPISHASRSEQGTPSPGLPSGWLQGIGSTSSGHSADPEPDVFAYVVGTVLLLRLLMGRFRQLPVSVPASRSGPVAASPG